MSLKPAGFNLFGPASSSAGLGVATRGTAALLDASSFQHCLADIPIAGHELGTPHGFEHLECTDCERMPYGINIFHVGPDYLEDALRHGWSRRPVEHRFNAIVPFWELSGFPRPWMTYLQAVDVVLAPSRHIMKAILSANPDQPVIHYPQLTAPLPDVTADRESWAFPEAHTVFLSAFDVFSDTNRKNPTGCIEAFRAAFGPDEPVMLVVRMKNADLDARYAPTVEFVRQAARDDPRIRVIEGVLPYPELLSLYASADVLVSLHRAEGLGLVLMEAMSLGTPVIATAWSGSMDFTTPENSGLVGFDLVPVRGLQDLYSPELVGASLWAEPRLQDAVDWMRALASDPSLRRAMAARARDDIAKLRVSPSRIEPFETLMNLYEAGGMRTERHRRATRYIRSRRRAALAARLKRLRDPRAIARRLARLVEPREQR